MKWCQLRATAASGRDQNWGWGPGRAGGSLTTAAVEAPTCTWQERKAEPRGDSMSSCIYERTRTYTHTQAYTHAVCPRGPTDR